MTRNLEEYRERPLNQDGYGKYVMRAADLDGSLTSVITFFQDIVRLDSEAEFDVDEDWETGTSIYVRWKRKLRPEEIAKIERDAREAEAKKATDSFEAGRRQFEALKAIYEP